MIIQRIYKLCFTLKNKIISTSIGWLLIMLISHGCGNTYAVQGERPRNPWVFRVNLDNIPRIVVLALDEELWMAYDTHNAKLYKAWKGDINFNGPMYDDRHNVQPSSRGIIYIVDSVKQSPWRLKLGSSEIPVQAQYIGYILQDNKATIQYKIQLKEGEDILIEETPEYVTNQDGDPGLERAFTMSNVPEGVEVFLKIRCGALESKQGLQVSGGSFTQSTVTAQAHEWGSTYIVEGMVTLNAHDVTRVTAFFDSKMADQMQVESSESALNQAVDSKSERVEEPILFGKQLIGLNDCAACHSIDKNMIGPSYTAIAQKYEEDSETVRRLAEKVINGGTGVWSRNTMTPHPELSASDAASMVNYILSLDTGITQTQPGIAANFYKPGVQLTQIPDLIPGQNPNLSTIVSDIEFEGTDLSINKVTNDFFGFEDHFVMHLTGFINVPETANYEFQLGANAGARFLLNGSKIADVNYYMYSYHEEEGATELQAGSNPFHIEFYEDIYSSELTLRWRKPGEKEFTKIPESAFTHNPRDIQPTSPGLKEIYEVNAPGYGTSLDGIHPSFDVKTVRPEDFERRIADLEFLPNGWLAVATWDSIGSVYLLENVMGDNKDEVKTHLFATGLYEVMGMEFVEDKLYVLQKWELTELIDHDDDLVADEYHVALDDWTATSNFHEWAFGLLYRDGYFYFNTGIGLGGNGIMTDSGMVYQKRVQTKDRGKTLKVKKSDWTFEAIAHGYKAPNGIGFGVDREIFSTDNEGHFVPTSKLMHVPQQGYPFFGNEEVLWEESKPIPELTPPVVWFPQNEIGNSPTQPVSFKMGPFQENQMIVGDIFHGGLKRIFLEKIKGEYQGVVFRFTQGLEAGINRVEWGPDGNLYMAGLGAGGDFGHQGHCCGLQRLEYNGYSTLDILAVRARSNGMEIEFTEPLRAGDGLYPSDYTVQQYWYETADDVPEGGVKNDIQNLEVRTVNMSSNRRKVFLEIAGMKKEHVIYLKMNNPFLSESGHQLWSGEAWYTLNNIPDSAGKPGVKIVKSDNNLLEIENKAGWKLLFDGKTLNKWQEPGHRKSSENWTIKDRDIVGKGEGSILMTEDEYNNFEFEFEWKVSRGTDAGIFFHVPEPGSFKEISLTGAEMQLIDDHNHPEAKAAKINLSGAAYSLFAPKYKLAKPLGMFNKSRLVVNDDQVEYWLNGIKVTEYKLGSEEWKDKVLNSRFVQEENFGKNKKGYIAFQIQEGQLSLKNIRIKPLLMSVKESGAELN